MKYFRLLFAPTRNRRFNELVAFVVFVFATLFLLALASYSPLDASFNTSGPDLAGHPVHNWIGMAGAMGSDMLLQLAGITAFVLPILMALFGARWWKSRPIAQPLAKCIGVGALLTFAPALLALLPFHWRWMHALPIEGIAGRIVGDVLIHYFNLTGAYILSLALIAIALYVTTAFSFSAVQLWIETRFAFAFAVRDRLQDWLRDRREARAKAAAAKLAAKMKQQRPIVTSQLVPKRGASSPNVAVANVASQRLAADPSAEMATGIERVSQSMAERISAGSAEEPVFRASAPQLPSIEESAMEPQIGARADNERRSKTVLPKSAGDFRLPSTALLHRPDAQEAVDVEDLKTLAQVLVEKCSEFDVRGAVTQINPGPVVTTYEFKPEAGIKYSRVTGLSDDLCLALKAESILIERMGGKSTVGIQVPNEKRETIWLREVVESPTFIENKSRLTLAMGKDINGRLVTADLATMPHLLIAGSTGAGKSVAINAMIMSLLYKSTPEQVRLILVDPKRLELGNYEGIPHLYTPIITEPKLASYALRNAVREMERRLKVLAEKGVRNIGQYNALFEGQTPSLFEEENAHKPLPFIVIIIDELADLMMLDGSNVEESITRLAQMARAVGIHLILATQRPSVDVITGLIKANFPARISFRVATKVDSRTILDCNGSESLLGRGDSLYLPSGSSRVQRVHAPFVTEKEIAAVVEFWKAQGQAQYDEKFLAAPKDENGKSASGFEEEGEPENDEMFADAVKLVLEFGKASTSLLQRRLRIGYGRAAHLIDLMEKDGIVGPADGPKPREILKRPDWLTEVEEALR